MADMIISPRRLTFIHANACDFCRPNNPFPIELNGTTPSSGLSIGDLSGWMFCNDCVDVAKQNVIKYCDSSSTIPFFWCLNKDVRFYRSSKKSIETGKMDMFDNSVCTYTPDYDMMRLYLTFGSEGRLVSLENIFHHNPELYQQLKDCDDLFRNEKIKISYKQLSPKTHELVEIAFQKSKQPSDSFNK